MVSHLSLALDLALPALVSAEFPTPNTELAITNTTLDTDF
jgi:hypothetical protein